MTAFLAKPLMIIKTKEVMEEYVENENVVAIRFADNTEFELPITITDTVDVVTISVSLDSHLYKASADNEFSAFQKLRDMLLDKGIGLKCLNSNRQCNSVEFIVS